MSMTQVPATAWLAATAPKAANGEGICTASNGFGYGFGSVGTRIDQLEIAGTQNRNNLGLHLSTSQENYVCCTSHIKLINIYKDAWPFKTISLHFRCLSHAVLRVASSFGLASGRDLGDKHTLSSLKRVEMGKPVSHQSSRSHVTSSGFDVASCHPLDMAYEVSNYNIYIYIYMHIYQYVYISTIDNI